MKTKLTLLRMKQENNLKMNKNHREEHQCDGPK